MKTMIVMLTVVLILNIFMYVGINFSIAAEGGHSLNKQYWFHFNGDLIDVFMSGNEDLDKLAQDTKENWTSYGIGLNASFTGIPDESAGIQTGVGGITFIDVVKMSRGFILTVANLAMAPLTLLFNFGLPFFIGLMIGIPYFFIIMLTIFAFIRGVGD